jgi:hypothetical protein
MATSVVVNPTKVLAVVPLVTHDGKTTSIFVQPGGKAEIPPGHQPVDSWFMMNQPVRLVTLE